MAALPDTWTMDRKIRYLERWHRLWEITHQDRLVTGTFASVEDLTHEHVWGPMLVLTNGQPLVRCRICPVTKKVED